MAPTGRRSRVPHRASTEPPSIDSQRSITSLDCASCPDSGEPMTLRLSLIALSCLLLVPMANAQDNGSSPIDTSRSEEHTSELQSRENLVCRLLLEKKKIT